MRERQGGLGEADWMERLEIQGPRFGIHLCLLARIVIWEKLLTTLKFDSFSPPAVK